MLPQTVHAASVLGRQRQPRTVLRQAWLCLLIVSAFAAAGCDDEGATSEPQLVWGRKGISDGRLQKPRAMAIDRKTSSISST